MGVGGVQIERTVFFSKADPSVRSPHVFAISRASRVACRVNSRSPLPLRLTHIHTYHLALCNMTQDCVGLVSLYALTHLIPFALSGSVSPHTYILCLSLCLCLCPTLLTLATSANSCSLLRPQIRQSWIESPFLALYPGT